MFWRFGSAALCCVVLIWAAGCESVTVPNPNGGGGAGFSGGRGDDTALNGDAGGASAGGAGGASAGGAGGASSGGAGGVGGFAGSGSAGAGGAQNDTQAPGGAGGSNLATGGTGALGGTGGTGGNQSQMGGSGGQGGALGSGGCGGPGVDPALGNPAPGTSRFGFESGTQGWIDLSGSRGEQGCAPVLDGARVFEGRRSLRYGLDVPSGTHERVVGAVGNKIGGLPAGGTVVFHIWVPDKTVIADLQLFMQTQRAGSWHADTRGQETLESGTWMKMVLEVPDSYRDEDPLELGVRFDVIGPHKGEVFIDAVDVQPPRSQ